MRRDLSATRQAKLTGRHSPYKTEMLDIKYNSFFNKEPNF